MCAARLPSSFEGDFDFYNEGRAHKLWRIMKREPLIPIGIGGTCYALWRAYKSMKAGTHHETNRMFRMRIYGQAATLIVLCGYSFYYAEEHAQEKQRAQLVAEQKSQEKKDAWIRELEARDQEAKEERARQNRAAARRNKRDVAKADLLKARAKASPDNTDETRIDTGKGETENVDGQISSVAKSALEPCEMRQPSILGAVIELMNR